MPSSTLRVGENRPRRVRGNGPHEIARLVELTAPAHGTGRQTWADWPRNIGGILLVKSRHVENGDGKKPNNDEKHRARPPSGGRDSSAASLVRWNRGDFFPASTRNEGQQFMETANA